MSILRAGLVDLPSLPIQSPCEPAQNGASVHDFCDFCERKRMKPINPWPLIMMLIVVVFLYLWLNGYLV